MMLTCTRLKGSSGQPRIDAPILLEGSSGPTESFSTSLPRRVSDRSGSLLDQSAIVYGSALSDGNSHASTNLPLLVAGGGRHIAAPEQPVANLFVDLLNRIGIPTESFGDSTAQLDTGA